MAVWNIKSPTDITLRMTFEEHEHRVVAVDLSEAIIIAGYWDKTIMVQSHACPVITYNRTC